MNRRNWWPLLWGLAVISLLGAEEAPAVKTGLPARGEPLLRTNAREGIFQAEQWFWFSPVLGELRLTVNGAELYRGTGPALVHLDVNPGEERTFEVSAEAGVPGAPVESRTYSVTLNRKILQIPERTLRMDGDGLAVLARGDGPERPAVYVSASGTGEGRGTREAPFGVLEDALEFARRNGLRDIRLSGTVRLRENLEISGDLTIYGSFDAPETASAVLEVPGAAGIRVDRGILRLRGIVLRREEEGGALFSVERGAGLELSDSVIALTGPLILARGSACLFKDTLVLANMPGARRFPVLSAEDGRVYLFGSRFDIGGDHGIFLDMKDGAVSAEDSRISITARNTGNAFALKGGRADFKEVAVSVRAEDYGSALDLSGSKLLMTGGNLAVSARDGVVVWTEESDVLFAKTAFSLSASFVARAMEIKGKFPLVSDCSFSFAGPAGRSEVFSGSARPGSVGGAVFKGFSHILGKDYPAEGIAAFNRDFAPADNPNRLLP
jgi:hypothetical protein